MSLKKKSKSLGHLTALGSPGFVSPKLKKQTSHKNFNMADKLKFLNHGYGNDSNPSQDVIHYSNNPFPDTNPPEQNVHPVLQRVPPIRSTTALNLGTPMTNKHMGVSTTNSAGGRGIKTTTPKVSLKIFLINNTGTA